MSAFSNTAGGWLVFGVRHNNGVHEIVGVIEVDKVQNEILSTLRSGQKLNRVISVQESIIQEGPSTLLVFYVPEARRQDKPVYLNNDIKQSYIRRGGGDERCRPEEIQRFIRDASDERYDCEVIEADVESFFDPESLRWYRRIFDERNPGNETASHSDVEFLHHWGLVIEKAHSLSPTRAAVILFGSGPVVRQYLPRPVVDCQWVPAEWSGSLPDQRWTDRIVAEDNLIRTWQTLVQKFMQHSEQPFQVDPASLRRDDLPPDYLAFRESAINLLIHQDYADHQRTPMIQFYRDRTVLRNPGDSFADPDELLDPVEKPLRNPRIVSAFRRIGLSDQAGTGFRTIFRMWQNLGHVPPIVENDKARKSFALHLLKEILLSEEQLLFHANLGVRLSDPGAKAFAIACRTGELRLQDVRAVTGLPNREAQAVLDRLLVEVLVAEVVPGNRAYVQLAEHLVEQLADLKALEDGQANLVTDQPDTKPVDLVTDQPDTKSQKSVTAQHPPLRKLSDTQWKIVIMCDVARSVTYLMERLGVTHRSFFRRTHLEPLIKGGVLKMIFPDQPNHPNQAYVLTEVGVELVARRAGGTKNGGTDE